MDILNTVIHLMTKEEQRNFKIFANRAHSSEERKDIQLFDYIRKSGDRFQERKIQRKLYPEKGKNAYSRLRNRLLSEVNKSICLLHWEKNDHANALQFLSLAVIYKGKQSFQLASYFLKRAEKKAKLIGSLELLDIIYGEFIGLSFELGEVNPESYIQKRQANLVTINRLREIDNILAVVNYRLKRSQNLGQESLPLDELLEKTMGEYGQDPEVMKDPRFRFRAYNAVSKILLSKRDYKSLEQYLLDTYESFEAEGLFNRGNHDSRLQMLTYIVNALFKNKKIEESLAFAEKLHEGMKDYNRLYYNKYLFFYHNSLATNYTETDIAKAMATWENMLEIEDISKVPQYQVFILLNLALFNYLEKKYSKALKYLVQLRLEDGYRSTDNSFRFRIDIFEIALRHETKDYETLIYRLRQFRADYDDILAQAVNEKDRVFVGLVERMNESMEIRKDPCLVCDIEDFLKKYERDDTEIFKYDDFMKSKIKN